MTGIIDPHSGLVNVVTKTKRKRKYRSKPGPKPKENPKQRVTFRFDQNLLAQLRALGPGWQVRVERLIAESIDRMPNGNNEVAQDLPRNNA